jgi:hypothetical protein
MNMKRSTGFVVTAITLLCLVSVPRAAHAQEITKIVVQAGGSWNQPFGDFAKSGGSITNVPETGYAENGLGWTLRALFPVSPVVSFYGEWTRPSFGTDEGEMLAALGAPPGASVDLTYRVSLMGVGVRVNPLSESSVNPYLQAGMGRYRAELDMTFAGITTSERSDVTNALNFGGGVSIPVGTLFVDVGVRYHSVKLTVDGTGVPWNANWLETRVLLSFTITP